MSDTGIKPSLPVNPAVILRGSLRVFGKLLRKKKVRVNYDAETPWIASRLQDFLGLRQGPSISGGAVPLVLHLLAPNNRALQVTTDLMGFWERTYKTVRPGLSRRYPKQLWPENPV